MTNTNPCIFLRVGTLQTRLKSVLTGLTRQTSTPRAVCVCVCVFVCVRVCVSRLCVYLEETQETRLLICQEQTTPLPVP